MLDKHSLPSTYLGTELSRTQPSKSRQKLLLMMWNGVVPVTAKYIYRLVFKHLYLWYGQLQPIQRPCYRIWWAWHETNPTWIERQVLKNLGLAVESSTRHESSWPVSSWYLGLRCALRSVVAKSIHLSTWSCLYYDSCINIYLGKHIIREV